MQPDGKITEKDLNRYIRVARLVKPEKLAAESSGDKLHRAKTEKDLEKLEEQIEDLRFNRGIKQGLYIERKDHELELASRAAALESHLRYKFHMQSGVIFDSLQKLDRRDGRRILEDHFNDFLDKALTDFADTTNYHVIFTENESSAEI